MVDFVLSEMKEGKIAVAEYNLYHYQQISLDKDKKALCVYAYTKRGYGDNSMNFLSELMKNREDILNDMVKSEKPKVRIK